MRKYITIVLETEHYTNWSLVLVLQFFICKKIHSRLSGGRSEILQNNKILRILYLLIKSSNLSQILIKNKLQSYYENNPFCIIQCKAIQKNSSPRLADTLNQVWKGYEYFSLWVWNFWGAHICCWWRNMNWLNTGWIIYQSDCVLYNLLWLYHRVN